MPEVKKLFQVLDTQDFEVGRLLFLLKPIMPYELILEKSSLEHFHDPFLIRTC